MWSIPNNYSDNRPQRVTKSQENFWRGSNTARTRKWYLLQRMPISHSFTIWVSNYKAVAGLPQLVLPISSNIRLNKNLGSRERNEVRVTQASQIIKEISTNIYSNLHFFTVHSSNHSNSGSNLELSFFCYCLRRISGRKLCFRDICDYRFVLTDPNLLRNNVLNSESDVWSHDYYRIAGGRL